MGFNEYRPRDRYNLVEWLDLVFGVPHLPIHQDQLSDSVPNKTDEKDYLCDNDFLSDMSGTRQSVLCR